MLYIFGHTKQDNELIATILIIAVKSVYCLLISYVYFI